MINTIVELCFYLSVIKYYYVYFFDNIEINQQYLQFQFYNSTILGIFTILNYKRYQK